MAELQLEEWAATLDVGPALDAAAALADPTAADLVPLAVELAAVAARVDPAVARRHVSADAPRAVMSRHPEGPVLGLRWYEPGELSTVHHHAFVVLAGLAGDGFVERWTERESGEATLRSVTGMGPGELVCLGERDGPSSGVRGGRLARARPDR